MEPIRNFVRQFITLSVALGATFLFVAVAGAWQSPTAPPPNGNTVAPINVGTLPQVKNGGLGVTNFAADQICLAGDCRAVWPGGGTGGGGAMSVKVVKKSGAGGSANAYAYCPANSLLMSCSGSRHASNSDNCTEDDCGYIGTLPVKAGGALMTDGQLTTMGGGCWTKIDSDSGVTPTAVAYCLQP